MSTDPGRETPHISRSAWRLAILVIAALPCGCALPGTDGQSMTSVLLAPFGIASMEAAPTSLQGCIEAGAKCERKGHVKEAIARYEDARRFYPAAPVAHRLALLYDRQLDVERARSEFMLALKANPQDAQLLNDMGYFAFEHGNWSEAEKFLRQSLAINSNNERAWVTLGLVVGRLGRYEESLDALSKILSHEEARADREVIATKIEKPTDIPKVPHPVANIPQPQPDPIKLVNSEDVPKPLQPPGND